MAERREEKRLCLSPLPRLSSAYLPARPAFRPLPLALFSPSAVQWGYSTPRPASPRFASLSLSPLVLLRFPKSTPEASNQLPPARKRRTGLHAGLGAWTDSAYFQNTLYVLRGNRYDGPRELLAYKVDEESWTNIQISALRPHLEPDEVDFIPMCRILVCGERVMMVVLLAKTSRKKIHSSILVVFEVFWDTKELVEVSGNSPMEIVGTSWNAAAGDDSYIYVYEKFAVVSGTPSAVVVYNIRQQELSGLPSAFDRQIYRQALRKAPTYTREMSGSRKWHAATSSFQPGLNPFIAL